MDKINHGWSFWVYFLLFVMICFVCFGIVWIWGFVYDICMYDYFDGGGLYYRSMMIY